MPTYEYQCDACGNAFEKMQPMSASPIKKCPKCGKSKVRRLISMGGGLIFKGSGFYITDYRDEGYKASAKADAGPAAPATSTDKSSGDNKSADNKADAKGGDKSGGDKGSSDKPAAKSDEGKASAPTATESKAAPAAVAPTKKSGKQEK